MAYSGNVLAFKHNWSRPITERLAWLTDVITARDGVEQRSTVRLNPRRTLEYKFTVKQANVALLDLLLRRWQSDTVMVPILTDTQTLTTAVDAGDTVIPVSTQYKDYDTNGYIILFSGPRTYEVVAIDSIGANDVTISEPLENAWPVGTIVAPARPAALSLIQSSNRPLPGVRHFNVVADILASSKSTNRWAGTAPQTYGGYDLLKRNAVGGEELEFQLDNGLTRLDNQIGQWVYDSGARSLPNGIVPYRTTLNGREPIADFLKFLQQREGRRVPFWHPSFDFDIVPVSATTGEIVFQHIGLADYTITTNKKHLAGIVRTGNVIGSPRGTVLMVEMDAVTDNLDGTETVEIFFGSVFTAANVMNNDIRFCLPQFCRLEQDAIELTWATPSVVQTKLSFREQLTSP